MPWCTFFTPRTYIFMLDAYASNFWTYVLWIYVFHLHAGAFLVHPTPRLFLGLAPKTFFKALYDSV